MKDYLNTCQNIPYGEFPNKDKTLQTYFRIIVPLMFFLLSSYWNVPDLDVSQPGLRRLNFGLGMQKIQLIISKQ